MAELGDGPPGTGGRAPLGAGSGGGGRYAGPGTF